MDFCKKISKVTHSVGRFWRDLVQLEKVIWVSSLVRKWSKDQLSPMKGKVLTWQGARKEAGLRYGPNFK
ncbi:hypothetical protein AAHA92_09746 [Salvia divinorum]|uniref:Uncharacterized protein n=1 Tax=Salvia divinorum TaxID=28513 RepID=A0ABD1HTX6_SALDI